MTQEEIIRLAAEAGAKAAMETLEKERQKESLEMSDRRLRNTKLLLRNYRTFKDHAANAVYEVESEEDPLQIIQELMMPDRSPNLFVESIKRSVARTITIVRHIETMLHLYQVYCFQYSSKEDERRWRVIESIYLGDRKVSISELAEREGVVERTIYKDIDVAIERLSALIFGIDGIKKR